MKVTAIEKMIVNSEEYIRALFEGIPFPVYVWQSIGNDFILVDYNQIANLKKYELFKTRLGQKASDLFKNHPDLIESFILCLKKKETITKGLKYRSSKEEDIKYLCLKFNYITPDLIILHVDDITAKNLNLFVQSATDSITIWDGSLNLIEINKIALERMEMAKEAIIGKNMLEIIPEIKETGRYDKYIEVLKTGKPITFEDIKAPSSIKEGYYNINAFKVGDGIGVMSSDITDRKLAEKKIKESEERYRELYEGAPNTYFSVSADGKLIRCNKSAINLLGYSSEELMKMSVFDLYADTKYGKLKAKRIFQKFLDGEQIKDEELQMRRKNGDLVWISLSVKSILDKNGMVIESQSMIIDISRRKNAEQRIIESEEKYRNAFERANLYKDLFAHDINNILQIINSSAELLSLHHIEPDKASEIIKKQVQRGSKLVNNVNTLTQIEDQDIKLTPINVCDVLKGSIEFINKAYSDHTIDIDINCKEDNYLVQANELLHDVFDNVLINAIKYNENEKIAVTINIYEEFNENRNYIKFEFIDNAMGISPEIGNILFKDGFKHEKGGKGMGLGLSLVDKIIQSFNGKIWVEEKFKGDYTKGSKFIILIPKSP